MDWILTTTQMPINKSKVWAYSAFGEAILVTVTTVKGASYFHGSLDNGMRMRRITKWATYDVIY